MARVSGRRLEGKLMADDEEIADLNEEAARWQMEAETLEKQRDALLQALSDLVFYAAPHMYENGQGDALEEITAIASRIEQSRDH